MFGPWARNACCRWIGAAAVVSGMFAAPAFADSVTASAGNGFGRILFALDPSAHADATLSGGVLTIRFDRKVSIEPSTIVQGLPDYVSTARSDADTQSLRIALSQQVQIHTSVSGNRFAVD